MENVQVGSMQQATLVVGVIALATDSDKGISDDSQVRKRCYSCKKVLLQNNRPFPALHFGVHEQKNQIKARLG